MANDAVLETSDLKESGTGAGAFTNAAKAVAEAGGGVLEYYIDAAADTQTLAQGSTVVTLASSSTDQAFINSSLNYIDQFIDVELRQRSNRSGSYLDLYKVENVDGVVDNVIGEVQLVGGPSTAQQSVELQWENDDDPSTMSYWEKRVITHELAHVTRCR